MVQHVMIPPNTVQVISVVTTDSSLLMVVTRNLPGERQLTIAALEFADILRNQVLHIVLSNFLTSTVHLPEHMVTAHTGELQHLSTNANKTLKNFPGEKPLRGSANCTQNRKNTSPAARTTCMAPCCHNITSPTLIAPRSWYDIWT